MKTQTIQVEGLPEGLKIESIEIMPSGFGDKSGLSLMAMVKVEKIQPRRIVLEEIESRTDINNLFINGKWWREVKENDLSLTKKDDKVSLCPAEWDLVLNHLFKSRLDSTLFDKLVKFIKENS